MIKRFWGTLLLLMLLMLGMQAGASQINVWYQQYTLLQPSNSAVNYVPLFSTIGGASSTEANVGNSVPSAMTITDINAKMQNPPGSGKTWKYTIRKNGVDTGATCTFDDLATTASFTGLPISFVQGDQITLKTDPTTRGANPTINSRWMNLSIRWTNTNSNAYQCFASIGGANSLTLNNIGGTALFAQDGGSTTPFNGDSTHTDEATPMPCAGTVRNLTLNLGAAAAMGQSVTATMVKGTYSGGGVWGAQNDTAVTCTATATSGAHDNTHTVHYAVGDMITIHVSSTGSQPAITVFVSYEFAPDVAGRSMMLGEFNNNNTSTIYIWKQNSSLTSTESVIQFRAFPCTISNLWARTSVTGQLWGAVNSGASVALTARKNAANAGSPGAITTTIAAAGTWGNDATDSAVIADGDNINMMYVPSSTFTSTSGGHYSIAIDVPQNPIFRRTPTNPRAGSRGAFLHQAILDYIDTHVLDLEEDRPKCSIVH